MEERYKFIEGKLRSECVTLYEGKFLDTWQDNEIYLYVVISNLGNVKLENSCLCIYAHSYFDLVNAEDWALTNINAANREAIKNILIKEYHKEIAKVEKKNFYDLTEDICK